MRTGRLSIFSLLCAGALASCARSSKDDSNTRAVPAHPSASVGGAPVVASVRPPVAPEIPEVTEPPELANAVAVEPTADGWIAVVTKDGSDAAKSQPLSLVTAAGPKIERVELPFSSAGDRRLFAENLAARRFLFIEGALPKLHLRVWDRGTKDASFEGSFPLIGGAAVSRTQALAVTGKMDHRGWVERSNGRTAALFRDGSWRRIDLPGAPEKDWFDCSWDVGAEPASDDFVLLQVCTAPKRPFAYALFELAAGATSLERIPFDNELFRAAGSSPGELEVEEDGTIDVGIDVVGLRGAMEVARLRGGKPPWQVFHVELPTRLLSSAVLSGDHVLVTNGGRDLFESKDGGKTFARLPPMAEGGMFLHPSSFGTSYQVFGHGSSPARVFIRRW